MASEFRYLNENVCMTFFSQGQQENPRQLFKSQSELVSDAIGTSAYQ